MRTASWILTPVLVFGLFACGDDGRDTDSTGTATTGNTTAGTTADATTTDATTTDATTTDATTTMGGSTTDGGELSCERYCALFESGCADFNEYDNTQACLDQCSQWPTGVLGATDGDSLGCRLYHVTVANQADPNVHCPHASPNGAGVCIDPAAPTCQEYCTEYLKNCVDELNAYQDEADCLNQCAGWWPGVKDATDGDSVGCRLYHGGAPAMSDPATHCPHAGPGGGGVCVVN